MIWKDVKPDALLKSAMSKDKPLAAKCFATLRYERTQSFNRIVFSC